MSLLESAAYFLDVSRNLDRRGWLPENLRGAIERLAASVEEEEKRDAALRRLRKAKNLVAVGEVFVRGNVTSGSKATREEPAEDPSIDGLTVTIEVGGDTFDLLDFSHTDALASAIETAVLKERS